MKNEFSHKVYPAVLHQLYLRLTAVKQEARPQKAYFAPYRSVAWLRPAEFVETQEALGKTRLSIVRYGQPVELLQQVGVTVVTSGALDLANMLNGVWESSQPDTLRLRQLTRLVDLASWVSGEANHLINGQFSKPTVIQGTLQVGQPPNGSENPSPQAHVLVGVLPFEIARLCMGYLILSLEAELTSYKQQQGTNVGEPFQLKKIIV